MFGAAKFSHFEVGLQKITEGHTVPLSHPTTTASEDSGDIIDKSFDDADQEHAVENSDDVLDEPLLIMLRKLLLRMLGKNERECVLDHFHIHLSQLSVFGATKFSHFEVGLLKITEGHTVPLSRPATTALEDSGDIIDKSFDDADQEHVVENSDDVLEELLLIMLRKLLLRMLGKNEREWWSGMPMVPLILLRS
nr:hypothetical protein [Tanacetum cinerariifolium]